jgi:hypothetical protein
VTGSAPKPGDVRKDGRRGLPLFTLHDFDVSGFSIQQTLVTSNRRYQFESKINHIDLGMRLADIEGLDQEPVSLQQDKGAFARRLRINGATQAEIDFLLTGPDKVGQRVELNAMNSGQFVASSSASLTNTASPRSCPDRNC